MSTKPPSCSLSYTRHMFVPREEALSVDDLIFKKTVFDGIAYSSIASCTLIIITTVLLSLHPLSKPKTDRVSFRLMIYALCGSIVYSISAILANHAWGEISCRVAGSLVIVGLHLSSFLFFCIGLNLQLVMIHGVDGTQAEKYYVWGSLLLAVALGVLTYASNELVYIATEAVCTYYDPNPTKGFLWRFGIQLLWGYLTMVGEIITFISVVVYMFRVKAFSPGPSRENTSTGSQGLSASHQYRKPLGPRQYRNVVLRIALYPLSALITTGLTTIGTSTNPSQQLRTKSDWALLNALLAVLMFRGTVYASVAVADPAVTQGLRVLFKHYFWRRTASNPSSNEVEIFVVRPVVAHRRSRESGLEPEGFQNSSDNGLDGRRTFFYESKSSVRLPKPAVIASPPHTNNPLDTSSSSASVVDVGSESQTEANESVHFRCSFTQLRQL